MFNVVILVIGGIIVGIGVISIIIVGYIVVKVGVDVFIVVVFEFKKVVNVCGE